MTKVNAKAEALSNEQLIQLVLSLKADKEAAEKRAAEAEAKAKAGNGKTAGISKDNLGRMAVQLPGSVAFSFYLDQWDKFEPQIEAAKAFIKANRKDMPDEATRKAASKVRDANKAK
jgi:hypothetical protein